MANIDILPPQLKININAQIRLRVLSGVLYDLTESCGAHIEEDLLKGIIKRDIIEEIILSFQDNNKISHGKIHFMIDWDKFELVVITDTSTELYKDIDFSNGYANVLDQKLFNVLKTHVAKLKKEYHINDVVCTFRYREKYKENEDIYNAAKQFMGHVTAEKTTIVADKNFSRSLETVFQGVDGILRIKFEFN